MPERLGCAAAALLLAVGCATASGASGSSDVSPEKRVAGGNVIGAPLGVKPITGTPVQVAVSFNDGTPSCMMTGAVTFARDAVHRWVYLRPTPECPAWLAGSWWAELRSGAQGWFMSAFSTQPQEGGQ
ncbi:MAG: hypothetical protein IPJ65_32305 [Archangiaceae bacterium]|nr:hypothetical protein [Archangiaceae bacterium]